MSRVQFLLDTCHTTLRRMSVARHEGEIFEALNAAAAKLEFTGIAYAFRKPSPALALDHDYSSVWPDEINREWVRRGFHLCNPVNTAVQGLERSVVWNAKEVGELDQKYLDAYRFVAQTPARSGCMVMADCAWTGPGFIVCSRDSFSRIDPRVVDALEVIGSGAMLHLAYLRSRPVAGEVIPPDATPLSERQLEIARWLVAGKTNGEIAEILGLSERNVVYHVSELPRKLDVRTRSQVVAWYVSRFAEAL